MRIVSWNINSVRLRAPLIEQLIAQINPDIICLQEIKCPNDSFPEKQLRKAGFEHCAVNGIKGYHGVATLSREPFVETNIIDYCNKGDGRHIATTHMLGKTSFTIHNFYVPAGGDEADPEINEKFAHKLNFLAEMKQQFTAAQQPDKMVLVGDLNIAPFEHDVWSSKQLRKVVSHTDIERQIMGELRDTLNWEDVARRFVPETEKLYSWWSYRAKDWDAADKGRRLDHIWVTPNLSQHVTHYDVLREARGWERPSDHAPLFIDMA